MKHRIGLALAIGLISGCSMTLPVQGQMQNSPETFSGTATGYLDGGGNLKIVSSTGAVCQGNFVMSTAAKAGEYSPVMTNDLDRLNSCLLAGAAPA